MRIMRGNPSVHDATIAADRGLLFRAVAEIAAGPGPAVAALGRVAVDRGEISAALQDPVDLIRIAADPVAGLAAVDSADPSPAAAARRIAAMIIVIARPVRRKSRARRW